MSAASEKAYRLLRERIFSGAYAPGERLKERQLCADLDVSRTPVREALRRLEAEGLVHIEPRRGGVVSRIDADEAAEIFALGSVIESFAASLAAKKATDEDLDELRALIGAMAKVIRRRDDDCQADYMELDTALHGRVVAMADSRRLTAALQQVVGVPVLVQAFNRYSRDDLRQSYDQHCTLVDALCARDPDWAESAMRYHILAGRKVMLAGMAAE